MFVGRARSAKIPILSGEFDAHTLALADALPYLLWTANADGLAEFFNVAWREYTGLSVQESAGLGWFGALHVDDVEEAVFAWERATATGEPYEVRHRVGSRDGTYRIMSGRAIALRDADGKVTKWVGTYTDVHDAVEMATRLERADLRYRALLEQMPANV
jgi:PAS domain S-box-containing protein